MNKLDIPKGAKKTEDRIIARGEQGNHCHVIVGEATIYRHENKTYIEVPESHEAKIRHLLEDAWGRGEQSWTGEHEDICLLPGTYLYVPQLEYDPYDDVIRAVMD